MGTMPHKKLTPLETAICEALAFALEKALEKEF